MKLVVTGSVAFDYLMSFPGKFTEHILPDHLDRISLSFLVDNMEKRRGGCGPNIAYTLALLGERPFLMATAGEDFGEYRQWLEAAGVDTSLVRQVPGKFTASFFCSTDEANNQIASFYTGSMANASELSFRTVRDCGVSKITFSSCTLPPPAPRGFAPSFFKRRRKAFTSSIFSLISVSRATPFSHAFAVTFAHRGLPLV